MTVRSASAMLVAATWVIVATVFSVTATLAATPVSTSTAVATANPAAASAAAPAESPSVETTNQPPAPAVPAATTKPALNPAATHSVTVNAATAKSAAASPAVSSSPMSLANGLIFLLALVLIAAWLVKRSGGMPAWRGGSSMKVVAALSVGPRERVLLVEVGGQQWLLGVTPSAINNLHHFEQPILAAGSADEFSNKLRQLLPQGFGK